MGVVGDVLDDLVIQLDELGTMLDGLDEAGWALPSRCDGWSVADVVVHLTQTNDLAVASAQGDFSSYVGGWAADGGTTVDDAAEAAVAFARGRPGSEVGAAWRTSADAMVAALRACDPHARVTWVSGELAARTLATTRLAETWIHTGDVAHALGRAPESTPQLWHIARLAWRTLPYAFGRAGRELSGPVVADLTGSGGEPWRFADDGQDAVTTVRGPALDWCLVAGRRAEPADTALVAEGPDAAVLELVRTYA